MLARVLQSVETAMTPAPRREIEAWLAELSVIVARRQEDEFTETLRVEAYASRLQQFPADVASQALLVETWRFWPSWAELEEVCCRLARPRETMLGALRSFRQSAEDQAAPRVTKEQADGILREFGFAPRTFGAAADA